jgi:hypothetical protein
MANSPYKFVRVRGMPVSDEQLLSDLRSVATRLGKETVGQKEYRQIGRYDDTTASSRFGSWNNALRAAGLTVSNEVKISDDRLFEKSAYSLAALRATAAPWRVVISSIHNLSGAIQASLWFLDCVARSFC